MIALVTTCAIAQPVPLVVSDPEQVSAVERAVTDFWPDSELDITAEPSPEVPRFELTYDTLFWITPHGVHQREVASPAMAVLLARSWVLSGAPTGELGWVPPAALEPGELPDELPEQAPKQRAKIVDDVWFGIGIRSGAPSSQAVRGMNTFVGVRRGPFLAQLRASSQVRNSLRIQIRDLRAQGVPGVYDTRYGVGLHLGVGQSLALGKHGALEGFLLAGTELQEYARVVLPPPGEGNPTADPSAWDFGFQFGAGAEIRFKHVGLRCSALLDLRAREPRRLPMRYATVALAFHP